MRGIILLAVSVILLAGCFGQAPAAPTPQPNVSQPEANNTPQMPAAPGNNVTPPPSNGTGPSPAPPQQGGTQPPPAPQAGCATLTPNCGACIAVAGCGWCKTSNSCLSGDASGPTSGQCQPTDWAVTTDQCQAPTTTMGTTDCASQYNCAFCLSGSGCKWCIQGARCADANATDSCLGGWLNQSYQCNYASR